MPVIAMGEQIAMPLEVMGVQDAVMLLTDDGYIRWCQNKPLEAADYKGGIITNVTIALEGGKL